MMEKILDDSWEILDNLIIYGFGKSSQANINMFLKEFNIPFIIDNNTDYRGKLYQKIPIISFEEYCKIQKPEDKIVIIASGNAFLSIKKSLAGIGKREGIDYIGMDIFVNEWYWRFHHKVCIGRITISVITKCTFNCQHCNMLMPYFQDNKMFTFEMLCNDVKLFFSLVDFVTSYTVVGGEPFLYKDLGQYLEYVGSKFRSRIGTLQLITNGTILPNEELLLILKKWDVEVRISDYTSVIPYQKQFDKFVKLLNKNEIKYFIFKQDIWLDFGLPEEKINMGDTKEVLKNHMMGCNAMCHLVHNGYYYYCSRAWCAEEAGIFQLSDGDKISLTDLIKEQDGKEKLLKYHLGQMDNGYLSYCKVCRGYKSDKLIRAGEQTKNVKKKQFR